MHFCQTTNREGHFFHIALKSTPPQYYERVEETNITVIFIKVSEMWMNPVTYYILPTATDEVPVTMSPSTTTVSTTLQTKGDNIGQASAF